MNIGTYLKNKREKSGITLREMERVPASSAA